LATAGEARTMQMLIQTGFVYGPSSDTSDPGPGGTLGVLWTPWEFGGLWSEVGVMDDVPSGQIRISLLSPLFDDPEAGNQSRQHFEASAGLIAVGSRASAGYLKLGLAAFRIEAPYAARKFLVSVPVANVPPSAWFTSTRWTMGAIVATGLRFGAESMRALPTVEGRLQFEPGASGETQVLVMVTGGVWFR
jgi:hypothetical protein